MRVRVSPSALRNFAIFVLFCENRFLVLKVGFCLKLKKLFVVINFMKPILKFLFLLIILTNTVCSQINKNDNAKVKDSAKSSKIKITYYCQ